MKVLRIERKMLDHCNLNYDGHFPNITLLNDLYEEDVKGKTQSDGSTFVFDLPTE